MRSTLNRRSFLKRTAGAAALAATPSLIIPRRAEARTFPTTWTWQQAANANGGFGNALATSGISASRAFILGDTWICYETTDGGKTFTPQNRGLNGSGYGRAAMYGDPNFEDVCYVGVGTLKGGNVGFFGYSSGDGYMHVRGSLKFGTSDQLASNHPRNCGRLLARKTVTGTPNVQYIFAAADDGIHRSDDAFVSNDLMLFSKSGADWQAIGLDTDGTTLICCEYNGNVYTIANATSASPGSATLISSGIAAGPWNDFSVIDGLLVMVNSSGAYYANNISSTFTAISFFSGRNCATVCASPAPGGADTVTIGLNEATPTVNEMIAKASTPTGTFSWISTLANFQEYLYNTTTPYWLDPNAPVNSGVNKVPGASNYFCQCARYDKAGNLYSAGAGGLMISPDGGGTDWYSVAGIGGSTESTIGQDSSTGDVYITDHDFTYCRLSSNGSVATVESSKPSGVTLRSGLGGSTYKPDGTNSFEIVPPSGSQGSASDTVFKVNGTVIPDAFLAAAGVNASTLFVDPSNYYAYLSQGAGGCLLGVPS